MLVIGKAIRTVLNSIFGFYGLIFLISGLIVSCGFKNKNPEKVLKLSQTEFTILIDETITISLNEGGYSWSEVDLVYNEELIMMNYDELHQTVSITGLSEGFDQPRIVVDKGKYVDLSIAVHRGVREIHGVSEIIDMETNQPTRLDQLVLGHTYKLRLDTTPVSETLKHFNVSGAHGLIRITKEGYLQVIGVGTDSFTIMCPYGGGSIDLTFSSTFSDLALGKLIELQLDPNIVNITQSDLELIEELQSGLDNYSWKNVKSIDDLRWLPNLKKIHFKELNISELNLTDLDYEEIIIDKSTMNQISLSNMHQLKNLLIRDVNKLETLSLIEMAMLRNISYESATGKWLNIKLFEVDNCPSIETLSFTNIEFEFAIIKNSYGIKTVDFKTVKNLRLENLAKLKQLSIDALEIKKLELIDLESFVFAADAISINTAYINELLIQNVSSLGIFSNFLDFFPDYIYELTLDNLVFLQDYEVDQSVVSALPIKDKSIYKLSLSNLYLLEHLIIHCSTLEELNVDNINGLTLIEIDANPSNGNFVTNFKDTINNLKLHDVVFRLFSASNLLTFDIYNFILDQIPSKFISFDLGVGLVINNEVKQNLTYLKIEDILSRGFVSRQGSTNYYKIDIDNAHYKIIDFSGFKNNESICFFIGTQSQGVYLIGNGTAYQNINFQINADNNDFTLGLSNFSFTASANRNAIDFYGTGIFKLISSGGKNNIIGGSISSSIPTAAVQAQNLEIIGTGEITIRGGNVIDDNPELAQYQGGYGILADYVKFANPKAYVYGGKGASFTTRVLGSTGYTGSNARAYTSDYQYVSTGSQGDKGGTGYTGGPGGVGVKANKVEINAYVYIVGGEGGTGSTGGTGGTGGKGSDINYHIDNTDGLKGGKGGTGGTGGNGGSGGKGNYAIETVEIIVSSDATLIGGKGGKSGNGGLGGTGGRGGKGADGNSKVTQLGSQRDGADGGDGGTGGTGGTPGTPGQGSDAINIEVSASITLKKGDNGALGQPGAGGYGGSGGEGGKGADYLFVNAKDGRTGNTGERGKAGSY